MHQRPGGGWLTGPACAVVPSIAITSGRTTSWRTAGTTAAPLKILTIVDEYSRECLAIVVARRMRSTDVLETLAALCMTYGVPAHIRSDDGSACTAALVRRWLEALDVQTLFIEPGSPWENGYVESFNGTLRDELVDREVFYTLTEAKVLIERWRREYNTVRPHSARGYRPSAPEAVRPVSIGGFNMSAALS